MLCFRKNSRFLIVDDFPYQPEPKTLSFRSQKQQRPVLTIGLIVLSTLFFLGLASQTPGQTDSASLEPTREQLVNQGIEYLRDVQLEDGSFTQSPRAGIGITLLILTGLMESGLTPDDPMIADGLAYVEQYVQEDGGIYSPKSRISGYETCLGVLCFHLAQKTAQDDQYQEILDRAEKFLRSQQFNEINGTSLDDENYGGLGYGNNTRPDLSNTQFFIDALHELGYGQDDPAIQDALVFVSRCQNLESEHNTTNFAAKNSDGGFYYTCAGNGESPAGTTENGGFRSYGSMSYAGLKSMIYAGVDSEDPRVEAVEQWLHQNYSVKENPGMGARGLYYYYHTMAKTLQVLGNDSLMDQTGVEHFWKAELIEELAKNQQNDGSWVNENGMYMESDPNLVTGYVLLVLAHCQTPAQPKNE